ncbi:hypothetical protein DL96DRAFT_1716511 [Flagelloscypha sp. PMI_526]|nr:hypothetical protein DL96DRAFT_1716511 [Flagelloscypha sp. PMI_526]
MADLLSTVSQDKLISFSDPRVFQVIEHWEDAKREHPNNPDRPLYPDWLLQRPPSSPSLATSDAQDVASVFDVDDSNQQQPSQPDVVSKSGLQNMGGSWTTARRNLLAWLFVVDHFCCHVTRTRPDVSMIVQVANILLPDGRSNNEDLLLWYEFLLGMAPGELRIHSRLFMMPLRSDTHSLIDRHLIVFIPTLDTLRAIELYLQLVYLSRRKELTNMMKSNLLRRSGVATMPSEVLQSDFDNLSLDQLLSSQDLWRQLRAKDGGLGDSNDVGGDLERFQDGKLHNFYLVPHPDLNVGDTLQKIKYFESHLSPFAATTNAFETICKWNHGKVSTSSRAIFSSQSELNEPPVSRPVVLEEALAQVVSSQDAKVLATAVEAVYKIVQELEEEFGNHLKFKPSPRSSQPSKKDNDGSFRAEKRDLTFIARGASKRLGFGFGSMRFWKRPPLPPSGGSDDAPRQNNPYRTTTSQLWEQVAIRTHRPLASISSSQWSDDSDGSGGVIALQPKVYDPPMGDGFTAQDIVEQWRRKHSVSLEALPADPPLPDSEQMEETQT